jgi:CheY-like chemotaxis protein
VGLTANVMEAEKQRCIAAGMNHVLTKPVAWPDLFGALAAVGAGRPEIAAPSQAPESSAGLLDETRLASLRDMAGETKFALFIGNAMQSAVATYAEMADLKDDPAELAEPAHRLAGSVPSFGLARIGALAREIELCSLAREDPDDLLDRLGSAVAATRAELIRTGMLAA